MIIVIIINGFIMINIVSYMVKISTSQELSSALQAAQLRSDTTQTQLAADCGLNRMTLQKIMAGRGDPKFSTLVALANALGLDLVLSSQLLDGQGPAQPGQLASPAVQTSVQRALASLKAKRP
jgi:DNA-binding phage protein